MCTVWLGKECAHCMSIGSLSLEYVYIKTARAPELARAQETFNRRQVLLGHFASDSEHRREGDRWRLQERICITLHVFFTQLMSRLLYWDGVSVLLLLLYHFLFVQAPPGRTSGPGERYLQTIVIASHLFSLWRGLFLLSSSSLGGVFAV